MYLIAEIGLNHFGNYSKALELVHAAQESGCNAVKFQYRGKDFFSKTEEMGSVLINDELEKSSISDTELQNLLLSAKKLGLDIGCSFFREEDIHRFENTTQIKLDFIKIPSPCFSDEHLVNTAYNFSKSLILSTGGHSEKEISNLLKKYKLRNTDYVLHCISNYPTALGVQNLNFMAKLEEFTKANIGYSSHDTDWEVCLLAMAWGATAIERHICIDKNDEGLDISSSSTKAEFTKLSKFGKSIDAIKGSGQRVVNQGELLNRQNLSIGLYATTDMEAGTLIDISKFRQQSPGTIGIDIEQVRKGNLVLQESIKYNQRLEKSHLEKQSDQSAGLKHLFERIDIGIPIRPHDMHELIASIKPHRVELHLSYRDVLTITEDISNFLKNLDSALRYSIHLPDYISKDKLFEPFSENKSDQENSVEIVNKCQAIASAIYDLTSTKVNIVGSFPLIDQIDPLFYKKIYEFQSDRSNHKYTILPQWLPYKAWYFGGAVNVNSFNSIHAAEEIEKHNLRICLDTAHLIMAANSRRFDMNIMLNKLLPFTNHLHLADAFGEDGEGVEMGGGELGETAKLCLTSGIPIIIEPWQGHLAGGDGFKRCLSKLGNLL